MEQALLGLKVQEKGCKRVHQSPKTIANFKKSEKSLKIVKKPCLQTEKMSPDNKTIIKTSEVVEAAYNCFELVEGKFLSGKN